MITFMKEIDPKIIKTVPIVDHASARAAMPSFSKKKVIPIYLKK